MKGPRKVFKGTTNRGGDALGIGGGEKTKKPPPGHCGKKKDKPLKKRTASNAEKGPLPKTEERISPGQGRYRRSRDKAGETGTKKWLRN